MTNKIVIAKTGFNALAETNPNNLIFSSDYNTLKYSLSGNLSITIVGTGSLQTLTSDVAHNLGYYPFFVAYVNDPDFSNQYNIAPRYQSTIPLTDYAEAYSIDENTIRFRFGYSGSSTRVQVFYYKIFKNNLGL